MNYLTMKIEISILKAKNGGKKFRGKNEKSMKNKLAAEFMEAQKGTGSAIKKKEDIRKMADANKAFSHYRW